MLYKSESGTSTVMSKKYKVSTEELEYQLRNLITKKEKMIEERTYLDDPTYKTPPTKAEMNIRKEIHRVRSGLRQRSLSKKSKKNIDIKEREEAVSQMYVECKERKYQLEEREKKLKDQEKQLETLMMIMQKLNDLQESVGSMQRELKNNDIIREKKKSRQQ